MALPIGKTPKLNKKETVKFFKTIVKDLKKSTGLRPTPKLKKAEEEILDHYAIQRSK